MPRRERLERLWVLGALALASVGCATKGDVRSLQLELRDELRSLAARQDSLLSQLRVDAMSTQDTLRTQSDQIFDFRGEISRQLQALAQGLTRLEALTGENQRGIAAVRDQLANVRRLPGGSAPPPGLVDSTQASSAPPEVVPGTGGNAEQLWTTAREQHGRGSLNTAQRAYQQFLEEYPSHQLAPDVRFYLADILIQQDRPEDALAALQEIQALYPTATRVPDALYRIAVLQREMDDEDAAKATLERLINTYPDATAALLARELLAEIG